MIDYEKIARDAQKVFEENHGTVYDVTMKRTFGEEYSQEEAIEMSRIISSLQGILHCVECETCSMKYATSDLKK